MQCATGEQQHAGKSGEIVLDNSLPNEGLNAPTVKENGMTSASPEDAPVNVRRTTRLRVSN